MSSYCLKSFVAAAALSICGCTTGTAVLPVASLNQNDPPAQPIGTGRLVVLMITDNTDHQQTGQRSIAVGTTRNSRLMGGFFATLGTAAGMTVDVHPIAGSAPPNDPFNCAHIVASIKNLPVQAGDAVMIYYSGHGTNIGTSDPSIARADLRAIAPPEFASGPVTAFPFLACGTQLTDSPNLDMIATWLAAKRPRLTVVMADACNSYLSLTGPPAESYYAAAAPVVVEEARLRSLFRESNGTVLITGSQPGHYSYYYTDPHATTGGVLTLRFLDVVGRKLPANVPVTWQQVGDNLAYTTTDANDPIYGPVTVARHVTDTQTPLLRVGAPFETAVPLKAASTKLLEDNIQIAQGPPPAGSGSSPTPVASMHAAGKTDQVAPGTVVGADPGVAPTPLAPRKKIIQQELRPNDPRYSRSGRASQQ